MTCTLFRKVLVLNGRARKTYFVCKCVVTAEPTLTEGKEVSQQSELTEQFCNEKCGSFKGMLRHLVKKHQIYLPSEIVCESCQIVLQNTCQLINHYKQHLESGLEAFNYTDESEFNCDSCCTNKNLVKMIRAGIAGPL